MPAIEVTRQARDELRELIETRQLPPSADPGAGKRRRKGKRSDLSITSPVTAV